MKKVLLLGDSIRMGYDKYVTEQLAGEAEVLFPSENCRFAVEQFNRIARDVLADFPVEINDLYALMCDQPKSLYSDMTHFYTPEGTKRLGDRVTQVLRTALDMGSVK